VNIKAEYFVPDAERVQIHVAETVTLDVTLQVREVDGIIDVTAVAPVVGHDYFRELHRHQPRNSSPISRFPVSGNMRNSGELHLPHAGVTGTASNTQIDGSQSRAKEVCSMGVGATSPEKRRHAVYLSIGGSRLGIPPGEQRFQRGIWPHPAAV